MTAEHAHGIDAGGEVEARWQAGDVAMVRGVPCIRLASGLWEHGQADRFAYNEPAARPLVVIDPEDAEAVGRLVKIMEAEAEGLEWPALEGFPSLDMTTVLRKFADQEHMDARS